MNEWRKVPIKETVKELQKSENQINTKSGSVEEPWERPTGYPKVGGSNPDAGDFSLQQPPTETRHYSVTNYVYKRRISNFLDPIQKRALSWSVHFEAVYLDALL